MRKYGGMDIYIDDIRGNTRAVLKAIHKTSSKIVLKGELGAGIGA
jgi:hypothetical protein